MPSPSYTNVAETVFRAGAVLVDVLAGVIVGLSVGVTLAARMSCGARNATGEFWTLDEELSGSIIGGPIGQWIPKQGVGVFLVGGIRGVGVCVNGVRVGSGVRVFVGVPVFVGVRVFVGVCVAVGVRVGVFVGVRVAVGVDVAVAVGGGTFPVTETSRPSAS